ncbi:MAG TPA: helix-turn-helix transcriptional regulator [Polyangiaceae bacterium]|nr:helix-turn-helix transcriptional regulator [Polyangiaceae bacterium]
MSASPSRKHGAPVRTPKPCPVYLSPRQQQVLSLVARGRAAREIAAHLQVSPSTARSELTVLQELDLIAFPSDEVAHRPTSAPPPTSTEVAGPTQATLRPRATPSGEYSFGIGRYPAPRSVIA